MGKRGVVLGYPLFPFYEILGRISGTGKGGKRGLYVLQCATANERLRGKRLNKKV
jgi:hypothetical protein